MEKIVAISGRFLSPTWFTLDYFIVTVGFPHWYSCPRSKWDQRQTESRLFAWTPWLILPSLRAPVLALQLEEPGPWTLGAALQPCDGNYPTGQGRGKEEPLSGFKPGAFFPFSCCSKWSWTLWVKITHIYSAAVLEVTDICSVSPGLNSGCGRGGSRGRLSSSSWGCSFLGCITPVGL